MDRRFGWSRPRIAQLTPKNVPARYAALRAAGGNIKYIRINRIAHGEIAAMGVIVI